MIWTDDYLSRIALEAENEIAEKTKSIISRSSFAINNGFSDIKLPDYVFDIKAVYWKGERLEPITALEVKNNYQLLSWVDGAFQANAFTPAYLLGEMNSISVIGNGIRGGKPREYFYYGFGENFIRINPPANENIDLYTTNLWGADNIRQGLIVEYYRYPDGADWKIPDYIRRRTIKLFVLWKAFAKEGEGQNLQAAKYYEARYHVALAKAIKIINNIDSAQIKSRDLGVNNYRDKKIARPVLPSNYGISLGYGDNWDDYN